MLSKAKTAQDGRVIVRDVLLMSWGKDRNGNEWPKQEIRAQESNPVVYDFEENKNEPIGRAYNVISTDKGVLCDIEIYNDVYKKANTVVPKLTCKFEEGNKSKLVDSELICVSPCEEHAEEKCNNNLRG